MTPALFRNALKSLWTATERPELKLLCKHGLPINNCRGQGYDNGSNMAGKYNGAQANILALNSLALFSPCACHLMFMLLKSMLTLLPVFY